MLPKENRLRDTTLIKTLFKRGYTTSGKFLFIRFLPNHKNTTQIAVMVGLKYSKLATRRNRLKRLIREALRKELTNIKPGYDLLIGILPSRVNSSTTLAELSPDLKNILNNSHLIKT